MAHHNSSVNHFLNDLIRAADQTYDQERTIIAAEIKPMKNASRAYDHDPTSSVLMHFITNATWLHLGARSAIQRLRLNGNDLHPMCFIRAVDHGFNEERTVTPKSPYKLRCSSRL